MIHGENVILYIDEDGTKPNRILAAAKSCELDVNQNFIQVCSPVSGRWDSFVPSTIGWTASVDMLVVSMANPQAWLNEMKQSATPITMRYYDTELGIYQVGQCWIASWKNGASVGSISTFSLQLQGTGEITNGEEWIDITSQCTFDSSSINPDPIGQQSIVYSGGYICVNEYIGSIDDLVAILQNGIGGYIGSIYFLNSHRELPQSYTHVLTQGDIAIKKIFLCDDEGFGYKIIIPTIEKGKKIKIIIDTISYDSDYNVYLKIKVYKRSI